MQDLSSAMQTALAPRTTAASVSRNRTLLFEIYAADFFPTAGVFDPSLATALWAKTDITWLGNVYQRRVLSFSGVNKFISGQFDNITLTIENADQFLSQFLDTHDINGMRLVVRYINIDLSAALGDSVVLFVGRLQAPEGQDIDHEQGDLTAKEELASLDIEIPRRRVSQDDPEGRSPNDPLFEGIQMNARPSMVKFVETELTRKFFFFLKKKDVVKYNQWSSESGSADQIIPMIGGRVQLEGLPIFSVDIGFYIIGIWAFAHGKVTAIKDFQLPDQNYEFFGIWNETLRQSHVHLGDPGGTGTNSAPDNIEHNYDQNTSILSRLAYVGFAVAGPESLSQPFANPTMDATPSLIAVVLCEMELPDGGGTFNQLGFSDSPVYYARHVLTSADYFGLDTRLVYDGELPAVHAERQRPIVDSSNGEFLALMSHDASAVTNGALVRLNTTGLLNSRYWRHFLDGSQPDPLIDNRTDIYSILPGGQGASGGDQQLTNAAGIGGQTVATSSWKYYYIDTPIGADQLQVTLTGSGDGTTFVKLDSKPTLTSYTAFAYTASPQIVTITNPTAGRWWIGIAGFQPGGTPAAGLSYSIIAVFTGGAVENVLPAKSVLRKAYTFNAALTDTVNASDFLNDVVLATGRLYKLTDGAGRIRIRAKKSSDSSFLISGASAGGSFVLVANVEPWRASLTGYLLIDVGLTTSETRKITTAEYYPTIGDTITLAVSGTGLTRSGATLSGGSTSAPSTGTVTVSGASGALVVTVFGIPINYTVTSSDNDNSVAAMLVTAINADPNLRQYIRAVWNSDNIVHLNSTVGKLSFATVLANNHSAQVASPLVAPTASATGSGTLPVGDYYLGYTLVDGSGDETLMSPLQKVTIGASQKVSVSSLGSLPAGASGANWYFSPAKGDDQVRFLLNNAGGAFTINTVPDPDQDFPPGMNSTGCETIRVMEVFNSLNTVKGSFKWSPSRSKINQVTGTFVDAANGFKRTTVTVNDRAHQRNIRQINKLDLNLSGVDNFSQASRLCYAALAENRDAGTKWTWSTDDAGIPLEVGDVVAINEYSVDSSSLVIQNILVNQPVIIEETTLKENFDVSFVGRIYSTSLLEGQTGRKPVITATTLKYTTEPPPVATNLAITNTENYLTGLAVDFDFGAWAHAQLAYVFMKGPSFATPPVEPSDSTYKLIDAVYPDSNNHGHLEIRATSAGTYWIKVVTQSVFGVQAASGHPVASFLLRPPAPAGLTLIKLSNGDRLLTWQPAIEGAYPPETYIVRAEDSGTSAVKRTATIAVGDHSLPAKWSYADGDGDQSKVTILPDGTVSAVAPVGAPLTAHPGLNYQSQVFAGDGDVEFEVDDRQFFGMEIVNSGTGDTAAILQIGSGGSLPQFIDADATPAWRRRLNAATKLTFRIRNRTVEYRYDDTFWAFAGLLLHPPAATFLLRANFFSDPSTPLTNEEQAYVKVRFLPSQPRQWVYSDGMAKEDFSSTNPTNVKFEVTQISASGIESLPASVTG